MSRLFASSDQNIGASALATVLLMNSPGGFPLGLAGLISLLFRGLFESLLELNLKASVLLYGPLRLYAQPSLWSTHICT